MKRYLRHISAERIRATIENLSKRKLSFRRTKTESMAKSLIIIDDVLTDARHLKLEAEVVAFALMYMRDNPSATLSEAILSGHDKWVV